MIFQHKAKHPALTPLRYVSRTLHHFLLCGFELLLFASYFQRLTFTFLLQVLHCIDNSADGGESTLLDGFKIAADLAASDPRAFELLAETPVTFTWQKEGDVFLRLVMVQLRICLLMTASLRSPL